jgi:hypothetical protein
MEATRSFETSAFTRPARLHFSEDDIPQHFPSLVFRYRPRDPSR